MCIKFELEMPLPFEVTELPCIQNYPDLPYISVKALKIIHKIRSMAILL